MTKLSLFLFFVLILASCNDSGGGAAPNEENNPKPDSQEVNTPEDEEANTPEDEEANTPEDEEANTPEDEEVNNTQSQLFFSNAKMNTYVVEIQDNQVTNEYPLIYNFQKFILFANELKIKISCSNCTSYSLASNDMNLNFYPLINRSIHIPSPTDDNSFISNFSLVNGESKLVTINGYDINGNVVAVSNLYLENTDIEENAVQAPKDITCSADMITNHSTVNKYKQLMQGECLDNNAYHAKGFLDESTGLFHIVNFKADPNNEGKERIEHTLVDLKNIKDDFNDPQGYLSRLQSESQTMLKRFNIVVKDNLNLANYDFTNYPEPKIYKDSEENILIASAVGNNKVLKLYKFDHSTTTWTEVEIPEITNIKKIKFSKRFENNDVIDILVYLKEDGELTEYSISNATLTNKNIYTFTSQITVSDFDVDYNGNSNVTKFALTNQGNDLYLAKYLNSFQLNNIRVTSCQLGNNNISFSNKAFDPIIKVSNDGRSWFKVNSLKEFVSQVSSGITRPNVYICKENKLQANQSLNAAGFSPSYSMLIDQDDNSNSISSTVALGGDLILSSNENPDYSEFDFLYLGQLTESSALFGKLSYLYRYNSGYNFPIWSLQNTVNKFVSNEISEGPKDYNGKISLYSSGAYDIVTLINSYSYNNAENKVLTNKVCFSYSDSDQSGINSTLDRFLGLNDLDYNVYDADSDGLHDYFELYLGLNPNLPDSDGNGVNDLQEANEACN